MTALTRNQIVSHAGKLVGNETVDASFTLAWLNNIVDTMAANYKWPDLEKMATGALGAGVTSVALPADFGDLWDVHGLIIRDGENIQTPLTPQTNDWLDLIVNPNEQGTPRYAAFNLNAQTWRPYPLAEQAYTWALRYRLKPARDDIGDDVIPFGSDEMFIQALFVRMLQFEDDSRYPSEYAVLQQIIQKHMGGYNKSPIKSKSIRFNADVFKGMVNFR